MTTDQDPMPGAEDFVRSFTTLQREDHDQDKTVGGGSHTVTDPAQPRRRVACVHLYRRYLGHCVKYNLAMATKAQFVAAVLNVHGLLPELLATGSGDTAYFFDRLIYTGGFAPVPSGDDRVMDLLMEKSAIDVTPEKQGPDGDSRRARMNKR